MAICVVLNPNIMKFQPHLTLTDRTPNSLEHQNQTSKSTKFEHVWPEMGQTQTEIWKKLNFEPFQTPILVMGRALKIRAWAKPEP